MKLIAIVSRSVAAGAVTVALWTALAGPGHAANIPAPAGPHGNPANGARLYQSCMGCHSLDDNDVGPKHRGVVGRKAASVADYASMYSPGMKKLGEQGWVWTPENIDKWIADPKALIPDSPMALAFQGIPDAGERADIIAYLQTQTGQ